MSFTESLKDGQVGESLLARWFLSQGFSINPVYEKELGDNKGPRLLMPDCELVTPDMQVIYPSGAFFWAECKKKTCFSFHGISGKFVDGINKKHYDDYMEVFRRLHRPVWLYFFHPYSRTRPEDVAKWNAPEECPTGLFSCAVNMPHNHIMTDKKGVELIYWSTASLKLRATLEDLMPLLHK